MSDVACAGWGAIAQARGSVKPRAHHLYIFREYGTFYRFRWGQKEPEFGLVTILEFKKEPLRPLI